MCYVSLVQLTAYKVQSVWSTQQYVKKKCHEIIFRGECFHDSVLYDWLAGSHTMCLSLQASLSSINILMHRWPTSFGTPAVGSFCCRLVMSNHYFFFFYCHSTYTENEQQEEENWNYFCHHTIFSMQMIIRAYLWCLIKQPFSACW